MYPKKIMVRVLRAKSSFRTFAFPMSIILFAVFQIACGDSRTKVADTRERPGRWSEKKANEWYGQHPWIVGCNFVPSTAVNQLEMWQKETFDLETIDRELGWAQQIGFNTVRVFLHNLVWEENPDGFKDRMDQFLKVA